MINPKKANEDKRKIVADLSEKLAKSHGVILTEYRGLSVFALTELRMRLRRIQGELRILQNRLTKIAVKDIAAAEPLSRYLTGPTAAIFMYGDPVQVAKEIKDFGSDKEAFKVKAGMVSGRFLDSPQIARLASMPSRQALICHVVGLISSPLRRLVTALSQPQRQVVQVLAQIAKKRGS